MEGDKKPRVAHKNYSSFGGAITKMAHDKHAGISGKAMKALDGVTRDLTVKLTSEASKLAEMDHRVTVKPRDIETAAKLILPGDLGIHAAAQINPAVTKVIAARPARKPKA
jgi:histone H2B